VTLKKERINKKLPEMTNLVNLKGESVPPSALEGKIVVIDFWATWCVPCMKEMPYLQAVYNRYKDNPKVMFMVINSGSQNTLEDARGWKGNKTYSFPVYYTNEKLLGERFGFSVIPSTFITSTSGYIQFRNVGFEGPAIEYKLATAIDLLLSELN
jgi:thiol-disulfide isomerase/thioredoxin